MIEGGSKLLKKIPKNDYLLNLTGMAYQGLSQHKDGKIWKKRYLPTMKKGFSQHKNRKILV